MRGIKFIKEFLCKKIDKITFILISLLAVIGVGFCWFGRFNEYFVEFKVIGKFVLFYLITMLVMIIFEDDEKV